MKSKKIQSIIIVGVVSATLMIPGKMAFANDSKGNDMVKGNGITTTEINNKEVNNSIYSKEIIKRVTEKSLDEFQNKDKEHKEFINWLLNNNNAMEQYLQGGLPSKNRERDMDAYHYGNDRNVIQEKELAALDIWSKIWNEDPSSKSGINLKIAIATSLEFASTVNTWLTDKPIDPIERYFNFKNANESNELFPCFKTLTVKDLRNVVNVKLTNDDIVWLRQYTKDLCEDKESSKFKWQKEHIHGKDLLSQDKIAQSDYTIQYTRTNPEGKSVFRPGFYGDNPTIEKVVEYGGVCGALSKYGTASCQVFGVPAYPVGQPGHCAFLYLTSKNEWQIGNNISGWTGTNGFDSTIPYMLLNETLSLKEESYSKSEKLRMEASNEGSNEKALDILDKAIKAEPLNYNVWEDKINITLKDPKTSTEDYRTLNDSIINTFSSYPQIMENLLVKIRDKVINNDRVELQNYISQYERSLNSVTEPREKLYANKLLNDMYKKGMYLVAFSFDGTNGGKLNGIKKDVDEYSLDGGKTYKVASSDSLKLSKDEIESINSTNGILVRVKGNKGYNLIDIKKGSNISISNNDDENLIFGLNNKMEFSINNGATWIKYDGSNLPDLSHNVTLLVRTAATNNIASGNVSKVIFTDKEAPKGLIPHSNIIIDSFSSEQDNGSQAANKAIDGNINTFWHTKWDRSDKKPYITLKLNKEYEVSKISYTPRQAGYNGYITKYNIYTSTDGVNFAKATSGVWQSNNKVKTAEFNSIKAKYIKIEVIEGVGGYASAADISVYSI
ncbi:MAG: discoidin domain-containing protein [Terrisporobacter sp.]